VWRAGSYDGRPLREILAARDIARLFRFLKSRGFSRSAIAAASGLSETWVRAIMSGGQQVTSYEVFERIADGLHIERGFMGLAYADTVTEPALTLLPPAADPSSYPDFLGALAAFAVGSVPADLGRLLPPPPPVADGVPPVVTAQHVAMLRAVNDRHRRFDADRGGGSCRDSAVAYLRWAHGMLGSRFADDDTERALKAAPVGHVPGGRVGLPRPW
jgi:transcriptional regulator with XRE-family HTH domain